MFVGFDSQNTDTQNTSQHHSKHRENIGRALEDLGLNVIDDLPEPIGWMKGKEGLFQF